MIWSRPKLRVLLVCTANICRSPLAEGLLRHRLLALGLAHQIQVRSAGTNAIQLGCRPDPRVEELAKEAGFSLSGIRAQMLTPRLIRSSDHVLVMERRHLEDVTLMCADFPDEAQKIRLLGEFLPAPNGIVGDIPDPYFGDMQGFNRVYQLIDMAVTGFLSRTIQNPELPSSQDW